jgi:uncharacterized protein (TIGR00730 family)
METRPQQPPDPNSFEQVHEDQEPAGPGLRDGHSIEYFVKQIRETADKLIRDHASRGDVKLLSTALKELRYAFKVFAAYRQHRKVTVFGSARLPLEHPACQAAIAFSHRLANAGYMVITGAANGIMEAGHVGAGREMSIGVNILLPFEQSSNTTIAGDPKLIHLKYFFTRKLLFVKEADAVALFPGGFGTLDEGFETLTLVQTGKSQMFPIVMVDEPGGHYWQRWLDYVKDSLLGLKLISPADLALFKVTDSVDEAIREILGFYRIYHSMRFVRRDLVLRLQKPLSDGVLKDINMEYRDILRSGSFEQSTALPEEANEPHLAHLARLRFHFDRHSMGRLRMLIDAINREGA